MTRPRIGIDFHVFDGMFQGSRTFILELFSRLIQISPDIDFYLFLEDTEKLRNHSPAFALPNVTLVRMRHLDPIRRLCWQIPMMQRKYKLDMLHMQYVMPVPSFSPCILSIHDILFERYPQYFTWIFRLRSKILMKLSAQRAAHIMTISEYSKSEIAARYGIALEKISVVYCGVDAQRFYPGTDGAGLVKKRGLKPGDYILSVGRLEPRKNHLALIRAYASITGRTRPLVLAGHRDFKFDAIFDLVLELGLKDRVKFLHDVSDEELPALYRNAAIFVYPTFAEGFGIPLVEAMSSGVPVISSNTSSIPEVVGDAGILVDPDKFEEIASAMSRVLGDDLLRARMRKESFERAKLFTWERAAERTREIIKRCI